jgi:hypothetical protein
VLVAAVVMIRKMSIAHANHRTACDGNITQAMAADPCCVLKRIFRDLPNVRLEIADVTRGPDLLIDPNRGFAL